MQWISIYTHIRRDRLAFQYPRQSAVTIVLKTRFIHIRINVYLDQILVYHDLKQWPWCTRAREPPKKCMIL